VVELLPTRLVVRGSSAVPRDAGASILAVGGGAIGG
jgi:hypothetical protein